MGFSMTSCPIGILIDRFGHSKAYLQVMLCVGLVLTALFPLAARSFESLLLLQLCMGLTYVRGELPTVKFLLWITVFYISLGWYPGNLTKAYFLLVTTRWTGKIFDRPLRYRSGQYSCMVTVRSTNPYSRMEVCLLRNRHYIDVFFRYHIVFGVRFTG